MAEPWSVYHLYRQLTLERIDIAYEVERRKMKGEPLDSAVLRDTKAWTLVLNQADKNFSRDEGYITTGQCYDALAKVCVR